MQTFTCCTYGKPVDYDPDIRLLLQLLGLIIVAWIYNRNRKEGIDPYAIFTQIPPA